MVITTKKGNGKLPLFNGNGERLTTLYATQSTQKYYPSHNTLSSLI